MRACDICQREITRFESAEGTSVLYGGNWFFVQAIELATTGERTDHLPPVDICFRCKLAIAHEAYHSLVRVRPKTEAEIERDEETGKFKISAQLELLARLIHEAGREAVAQGKVYRDDLPAKPFCEWDDLPAKARVGRFMMARFLLDNNRQLIEILSMPKRAS
jgi:hypothetical protein